MKRFYKVHVPFHHDELSNEIIIVANDMQGVLEVIKKIGIKLNNVQSIEFIGRGYD